MPPPQLHLAEPSVGCQWTPPPGAGDAPAADDIAVSRISRPDLPPWFGEVSQRIRELLCLPPNWDTYGAPPASVGAAHHAMRLTALLGSPFPGLPPPAVIPTVDGTIQLEWDAPGYEIELEVRPGNELVLLVDDGSGEATEQTLRGDLAPLGAALAELLLRIEVV